MRFLLYLLISGAILYWSLALAVLGAVAGRKYRPLGVGLVWGGVALALASAMPLHPALYAILVAGGGAWQLGRERGARAEALGVAFLVVAAGVVCCAAVASRVRPPASLPAGRPVYVLGDSVSAGLGPSSEGTWPQLLSMERGLRVSNLARAGATLAGGVLQARGIPPGPATVLVELGGNDVLVGSPPARFAADLRALLVAVGGQEHQVLMFELPLLPFQAEYGRIQRREARAHGVALLPRPLLAGAVALPGHTTDGLHLSPRGHSWLARRVGDLWV